MRSPGYLIATADLASYAIQELTDWLRDQEAGLPSLIQIARVATLEGLSRGSFRDGRYALGLRIHDRGVAAFDTAHPKCVIIPSGIGYDINCGIRLLPTELTAEEVLPVKSG
jgi:tRNA-splicing ligase RtcB